MDDVFHLLVPHDIGRVIKRKEDRERDEAEIHKEKRATH